MSKELIKKDPRDLSIGGFTLRATGVNIAGTPKFEEWQAAMQLTSHVGGAVMWWVGDLLNYGEAKYGDLASQEDGDGKYSSQTLWHAKSVAKAVPACIRMQELSWAHHQVVASLPTEDQSAFLKEARGKSMSVADFRKHVRAKRIEQLDKSTPPVPDTQTYQCVVIDPPWPVVKISRDVRPNQTVDIVQDGVKGTLEDGLDYPTIPIDELRPRLAEQVGKVAAEDCHLYLWVTHKFLPIGLEMLTEWGFNYQCTMTWVKPTGMTPFSWMYNTEHVLFARRGSLDLLVMGQKLSFEAPVDKHSAKPDVFFERVTVASPGPRISLYERKQRNGFEVWGNEV